jgi:enoyl-CoA hydratase
VIRYQVEEHRATVTIDDPVRHNPLTVDAMGEVTTALRRAARDERVAVVVITGEGEKSFSAGGDLGGGFIDEPLEGHAGRAAFADMLRAVRTVDKPVVARVNGHALAGGLGLAAACDIVLASGNATFGATEIKVGLWPMMISAVLVRTMPRRAALEMLLTGRRIDAHEAQRLGLVSRVLEDHDALDAAVDETVSTLGHLPRGVLALGRAAFFGTQDLSLDAALDVLHVGLTSVAMTEDAQEGVTAFLEKRAPRWSDD